MRLICPTAAVVLFCLPTGLSAQSVSSASLCSALEDRPADASLQALGLTRVQWQRLLELDERLSGRDREFTRPLLRRIADATSDAERAAAREKMRLAVGRRRLRMKHEFHQLLSGKAELPIRELSNESLRLATLQREGLVAFGDADLCAAYGLTLQETGRIRFACQTLESSSPIPMERVSLIRSRWDATTVSAYLLAGLSHENSTVCLADLKRSQSAAAPASEANTAERSLLHESALIGVTSAYDLLKKQSVQRELGLSKMQAKRLNELRTQLGTAPVQAQPWLDLMANVDGRDAEGIILSKLSAAVEKAHRPLWQELNAVLSDAQADLLKSIFVTENGARVFLDWRVCRDVGLSPVHAFQLSQTFVWHRQQSEPAFRRNWPPRPTLGSREVRLAGNSHVQAAPGYYHISPWRFGVRVPVAPEQKLTLEELLLAQLGGRPLAACKEYLQNQASRRKQISAQLQPSDATP